MLVTSAAPEESSYKEDAAEADEDDRPEGDAQEDGYSRGDESDAPDDHAHAFIIRYSGLIWRVEIGRSGFLVGPIP